MRNKKCGKYQPCRMFVENTLAVEITMSSVKTQAAIFKDKFGVNQHDKALRKQQSLGLRLKKLFPSEDIIEEYFHYVIELILLLKTHFSSRNGWKGHLDRDLDYERKRRKDLEKVGYYFIRTNPNKPSFDDYEEFGKVSAYIAESIKKETQKSTKKLVIDDLSKRLLELEFKSNLIKMSFNSVRI